MSRQTFFLILLFLSVTTISCSKKYISPPIPITEVKYNCFEALGSAEVFKVISEVPVFRNGRSDLINYLQTRLDQNFLEAMESAALRMEIIVFRTGKACLAKVAGPGIEAKNTINLRAIITNMPEWKPGIQGGVARHTQVSLFVRVKDGQLREGH